MKKRKIKILNFYILFLLSVFLIVENISHMALIKETWESMSQIEITLAIIISTAMGILGIFLIYQALLKFKKLVYYVILIYGFLYLIAFLLQDKNILDFLEVIVLIIPMMVSSFLILLNHKFSK